MDEIRQQLLAELDAAQSAKEIEAVRIRYLGKKGLVTTLGKSTDFSQMSADEKREFGTRFNELKEFAKDALASAGSSKTDKSADRTIDLALPSSDRSIGALHPITLVQIELEEIFAGLGFMTIPGFEVEEEFFNFDALNIPADHPARDMQDTYWLENGLLLRTHTSASQVRVLRQYGTPLRAIFPGRCFRYETIDDSHDNSFFQLEGLMVDQNVSVATLIAVMKLLLSQIFHRDVKVRLRPGYFPFVEPGFELDLECLLCGGAKCSTCRDGWIELMPCGLVHPRVLENGGVDSQTYSGFAFGLGLTRLAMMKFSIRDIRLLNSGDIRFCEQFAATI